MSRLNIIHENVCNSKAEHTSDAIDRTQKTTLYRICTDI